MILAEGMLNSVLGYVCCGGVLLVVLVAVGAVSGSKKKSKGKGGKKRSQFDAREASDEQNRRIIADAYRQFDRLTADDLKGMSKNLGKDLIGEPPTMEREVLKALATAKRLDTATTLKQIVNIRGDVEAGVP